MSPFLDAQDSLDLGSMDLSEGKGCGFKNLSSVLRLRSPATGQISESPFFVKIGETDANSRFHRDTAMLRRLLRLPSVPVRLVRVSEATPYRTIRTAVIAAMDRGQEGHNSKKRKRNGATSPHGA